MLMTSLAERRAFLYGLLTHKKAEYDCPQKSDVSALCPFVLLDGASGGFQWKRMENLYPYVTNSA